MRIAKVSRKIWTLVHRSKVSQLAIVCATYVAISYYIMWNATMDSTYSLEHGPVSSEVLTVKQPISKRLDARRIVRIQDVHRIAVLYKQTKFTEVTNINTLQENENSSSIKQTHETNTSDNYCDINQHLCRNYWLCKSLIFSRGPAYKTRQRSVHANHVSETSKSSPNTNCNLQTIHFNCTAVVESYMFGKELITKEEEGFPLAFALKIHRSPNQAHRLLQLIYRRHNIYCIHIDSKSPEYIYDQFKALSKCFHNIVVIEDRVNVVYSTIRQIEAEIKCMDVARMSTVAWTYYINLTGQEYMLKTNYEIVKILKLLNGTNDIEGHPVDSGFFYRFGVKTKIRRNKSVQTYEKKEIFHRNITLRKGSAYGMFNRKFVEFLRKDALALEFISWLNETYAPEEFIWATLNYLPSAPGGYQRDVILARGFLSRTENWYMDRQKHRCQGKYSRWVCIFGTGDLPWLIKQREIVANKFSDELFPLTLDCLEQYMYRRTMGYLPDMFDENIYTDAPHMSMRLI